MLSGDISISGKSAHQDILSRYYDDVMLRRATSIPGADEGFQGLRLAAGRADGADDLGVKHRLPSIDRAVLLAWLAILSAQVVVSFPMSAVSSDRITASAATTITSSPMVSTLSAAMVRNWPKMFMPGGINR